MNRYVLLLIGLSLAALTSLSQEQGTRVTVENPGSFPRLGEIVEIRWTDLLQRNPYLPGDLGAKDEASGRDLPSQLVDENLDGTPDLLLVRVSVPASGSTAFLVGKADKNRQPSSSVTDARFVPPREDLAWENDRIAFRMYGPALAAEVDNGIDVWTKRVRYPIVDKWYKANEGNATGKDSYHEDHGEGADFFAVGRTLGVGGCALINGDSLYQPGVFSSHRIIAQGPLRAMFELDYKPVLFNGKSITQTLRISLDAGSNLNRIEVLFRGNSSAALPFAAGIVKRPNVAGATDIEIGFASLWGLTTNDSTNGFLGTAVLMPRPEFKAVRENANHFLILGSAIPGVRATYYAGAGWTRSGDFRTDAEWRGYLKDFSSRIQFPLKVSFPARQ